MGDIEAAILVFNTKNTSFLFQTIIMWLDSRIVQGKLGNKISEEIQGKHL